MGRQKRPTLRTIANMSGFSVPTVSRALSNAPDIRNETKEQVRLIAEQIGYVPDQAGLRLRTGKTQIISVVISPESDLNDHSGKLVSAIGQALVGTSYQLSIMPQLIVRDGVHALRNMINAQSMDAVILSRVEPEDARVRYLIDQKFPFVSFGRTRWHQDHAYFAYDDWVFGYYAVQELANLGRTSLVLFVPTVATDPSSELVSGAMDSAARFGVSLTILREKASDDPAYLLENHVEDHLTKHTDTDGFICPSVVSTIATTVAIEAVGKVIGKEIDVYAKHSAPFLTHFRPEIQNVHEDIKFAGAYLARAAVHAIDTPEEPPMQYLAVAGKESTRFKPT